MRLRKIAASFGFEENKVRNKINVYTRESRTYFDIQNIQFCSKATELFPS